MPKKDLNKYKLSFTSFIGKIDLLSKLEIPEGYKVIDARKYSETKSKNQDAE